MPLPVENIAVDDLQRPADNPNVMDEGDFAKLVESVKRDGFTQPVLVRAHQGGYEIIDGQHRVDAVREAGLTEVSCVVIRCSPEQARALRVSMNRLRGELDLAAVAREFKTLVGSGWTVPDLAALGFTDEEVAALLDAGTHPDPEAMPTSFVPPDPPSEPAAWILEIEFQSREEMSRARRRLRRLAGKGAPLAAGLLKALAED